MKRLLYIGQFTDGTTSQMRAKTLKKILKPIHFEVIDTHIPFFKTNKIWRSLGFRYKTGPLISAINTYIKENMDSHTYDLIWVDKAAFITPKLTRLLKTKTSKLVHFTPDMAFFDNQSRYFKRSLKLYDFVVTTKTIEKHIYRTYIPENKLLWMSQGYSKHIHKPHHVYKNKDNAIVFIGLAEKTRYDMAKTILSNNLKLKLVGHGWGKFVENHRKNPNLIFLGKAIYGDDYSKLISSSRFALGLLSKRFQEFHTTRTFEIPACGTALVTERNSEIEGFFRGDEVIFYDDYDDMVAKIIYFMKNDIELQELTEKGYNKVTNGNFDYESQLYGIIKDTGIIIQNS